MADPKIDKALFDELAREVWLPHLSSLMAAMMTEALGEGRQAQDARKEILSRLFGRPTEKIEQESKQAITISVKPFVPEGEVIEGEARVIELTPQEVEPAQIAGLLEQPLNVRLTELMESATTERTPDVTPKKKRGRKKAAEAEIEL